MPLKEIKNYTTGQSSPEDKLRNFARHDLANNFVRLSAVKTSIFRCLLRRQKT